MTFRVISPATARDRLAAGDGDFVLLDCREPVEVAIVSIPGSVFLPMNDTPRRAGELDRAKEIAVICHHGMRSQQVADYLSRLGFPRVASVRGGIDAWAAEVDPTLPHY